MKIAKSFLLLISLSICLSGAIAAQNNGQKELKILKKATLGGEGGWDFMTIDPEECRLYISRATHVMVVDADTLKIVGDIPDTKGVHGIAIVPELNKVLQAMERQIP